MSPATSARVIALDGPAGSGKSTVAKGVARALRLPYLDTGATYRAATLAVLRARVQPSDADSTERAVAAAGIRVSLDPDDAWVRLDDQDVTAEIRGAEVTAAVSAVSAVPSVRRLLVDLQRRLAAGAAVVEGRDIGTVVVPDAVLKIYLDASPMVRAARRAGDADAGVRSTGDLVDAVAIDLARRDRLDSTRLDSPLQAAPDAVRLDTSSLSVAEVVVQVVDLAVQAGFERAS